jgi:PilZ domain
MQNRRSKVRYPISSPVRFTVSSKHLRSTGFGTLVDISSKGVAFRAEAEAQPGMKISASIGWPVMLGDQCALQLCVDGRVVRVEGSLVAVSIERYDFRTVAKVKTTSGLQLLNKADVLITDGTDFR